MIPTVSQTVQDVSIYCMVMFGVWSVAVLILEWRASRR